jgi:molybdopterin converting factor small subunit
MPANSIRPSGRPTSLRKRRLQLKIEVRLYGVFRIGRFDCAIRDYPAGTCVSEVVHDLGLPERLLGIVVVNDRHTTADHRLQDGDCVTLLPLLDGG